METLTSAAIIMRVKEFGESDLLVTFFTPDNGRLKGVAKGALRSRKRFVNCLDIFSFVTLEFRLKARGGLHFINSGKLIDAYSGLRSGFSSLLKASYMVELTEILFPWELSDHHMFEILNKAFSLLARGERKDIIHLIFESMAMSQAGFGINLEKCCVCGRKYSGEGIAVFKPEKGGIACLRCQEVTAVTPKLEPESVEMIKLMQTREIRIMEELNPGEDSVREIIPVLKLHREYHLGTKLKSAVYMM